MDKQVLEVFYEGCWTLNSDGSVQYERYGGNVTPDWVNDQREILFGKRNILDDDIDDELSCAMFASEWQRGFTAGMEWGEKRLAQKYGVKP